MDPVGFAQLAFFLAELGGWVLWFQRPAGYRTVYRMYRGGWWLHQHAVRGVQRVARQPVTEYTQVWWPTRWKRPDGDDEPAVDVPILLGALTVGTFIPTLLAIVVTGGP